MPLLFSTNWLRLLVCSVSLVAFSGTTEAGKLSNIKKETQYSNSDEESEDDDYTSPSERSRHYGSDSDDDGLTVDDIEAFFHFVRLVTSPFTAPYMAVEHDWWQGHPGLLAYPYQDGYWGYGAEAPALGSKRTAVRMSGDAGRAPWGHRYGGELRLTFRNRVDATFRGQAFYEPGETGLVEELYLLEPGVGYVFALGQLSQFRVGVEGAIMSDFAGSDALGLGVTYGVDCFPARPLALSLDLGMGQLGDVFYMKAKGTVGLMLGPIEPQIGYEARRIGRTYVGTASAGVRFWF